MSGRKRYRAGWTNAVQPLGGRGKDPCQSGGKKSKEDDEGMQTHNGSGEKKGGIGGAIYVLTKKKKRRIQSGGTRSKKMRNPGANQPNEEKDGEAKTGLKSRLCVTKGDLQVEQTSGYRCYE